MSSRTRTRVEVTTETAVNWVNNEMMSGFISIANAAGADVGWLVNNRDRLTTAVSTWLENEALSEIELQIRTRDEAVLDSYVFSVSYRGDRGFVEFPVEEVRSAVTRYDRDVYVYVSPVTYRNERSNDFGYEFSDTGDRSVRNLASFGAGHIDVNVGKAVKPTSASRFGVGGALGVFAIAGAGFAVLWTALVAMNGAVMELVSFVLPTVVTDLVEVVSLLVLGVFAYVVSADSLDGIGIYVAVPSVTFLLAVTVLLPLQYVAPFEMAELPLFVAFGVTAIAAVREIGS